jgi:hypothetical protein
MFNLSCKAQEQHEQADWEIRMRRFQTPMSFTKEGQTQTETSEYAIGGCRGSIVTMEVNATKLRSLKYEVLAPSGTTIASENLYLQANRAIGKPIRLPESGFYRVRLTTSADAESRQSCLKYQNRQCVSQTTFYVYPYDFQTSFRGNPEAPALHVGERGEGTVTVAEPLSRRITVEAGQKVMAHVSATGGSVLCSAERGEGGSLATSQVAGGCQVVLPEGDRDATYVLGVTTTTNTAVGISISVEPAAVEQPKTVERPTLAMGKETEGLLDVTAPPGSRALIQAEREWNIELSAPGSYSLVVVPSGLARLEVAVTLYNRATEEVVIDRVRVTARRTISADFAAAGAYVLRITPMAYDAQVAQGHAKYTLLLQPVLGKRGKGGVP